ncbi:MAG: carboxypeptidase-like regulatory domain-containing protein [Bacteroidales bacterium]|jgi:hypothetical protein|nr:carboxypeptidase-like regulatory domain-containing protein [Bacteroidales bacterium]
MKKTLVFISVLFFFFSLSAQRIDYKSKVYDGINYLPLSGVSVYNLNTNTFAFTNDRGEFTIKVQIHDTLVFTKSIYRQHSDVITENTIQYPEDHLLFFQSILLKEVVVYAFNPNYEEFKRELSTIKLPDVYKKIYGAELSDEEKANAVNENPNLLRGTPMESPITALYNVFSKRVKMQQLYYELVEHESEIGKLPSKYNKELVSEVTGLQEPDLMEFMVYCRFSYYDLLKWSPQQIVSAIQSKFNEYEYYKLMQDE